MPQFEPGHRVTGIPVPGPPRRQLLHKLKPPAGFRLTISEAQLRHSGTALVSDLHPYDAVPGSDCHRDGLTGSARAAVPDAVAEQLSVY